MESARQDRPRPPEVSRDDEEPKDRLPERDDALRQPDVSGKGGWQEEGDRRHEDEPSALSDPGWADRLRSTRTVGFGGACEEIPVDGQDHQRVGFTVPTELVNDSRSEQRHGYVLMNQYPPHDNREVVAEAANDASRTWRVSNPRPAKPVKGITAFYREDFTGMVVKVAVITGWDRSGSTILANILGSTPGVITLGEINNVWERGFGDDLMCSCEQRFSRCELWRPIAEGAFGADLTGVAARAKRAMDPLGNAWLLERRLPQAVQRDRSRSAAYAGLLGSLYRSAHAHTAAESPRRLVQDPVACRRGIRARGVARSTSSISFAILEGSRTAMVRASATTSTTNGPATWRNTDSQSHPLHGCIGTG